MKNTGTAKKQTSQLNDNQNDGTSMKQNTQGHIKIVKPRPSGTDASIQGPRDCFPLG